MNGVIILDKPEGITSHDAVFRLRRLCGTRKVGHAGTLDPMATGVLPIMIGNAVKASQFLTDGEKCYRARMRLGLSTDTEDITGNVVKESEARPSFDQLLLAAKSFLGDYWQVPPMYSALKVNGKKLYELAREHIEIERQPRRVCVHSIELFPTEEKDSFDLEVSCSKGTYIRTLIVDVAARAGALATMTALRRIACSGFSLGESHTLSQLEEAKETGRLEELLFPTERLFSHWDEVRLVPFYERLACNGQMVFVERARIRGWEEGKFLRLCKENGAFFALGQCVVTPEGRAVKTLKQFPAEE